MSSKPLTLDDVEASDTLSPEGAELLVRSLADEGDDLMAMLAAEVTKKHLSSTKDSFETLWSAGLGAGLKRVMERGHDDEAASARIPAILEVASAALALETNTFQKLEDECALLKHTLDYTQASSQGIKAAAFGIVADFALGTAHAQELVSSDVYLKCLETMTRAASVGSSSPVQVHALHCIAATFTRLGEEESHVVFQSVNGHVFNGATLLAHCLRMLKAAFEDVAVASHAVLAGICHHSWGRTLLDTQPSFFEVVSDRTSTYGYEVAKLKYKIAQLYAENKDKEVDAVHRKRFAQIVKEGPFAKDVVPGVEVATES